MNLLLLLPLAFTFVCLALVSLLAFLSVVALAGALRVIGTGTSALGIAGRKDEDPWHGAVSDAHPLDYVDARDYRAPLTLGRGPFSEPGAFATGTENSL